MYKFRVEFHILHVDLFNSPVAFVLADTYQQALKMAYLLAEQRYWSNPDYTGDLFGISVSQLPNDNS